MQVRNKIPVSPATLEQLEAAGCGCGFRWYLICSGRKFGSTDDFHDCSAVAATLDCRCSFFVCHSDLLGDSVPNHRKEKGRTIKILSQLIPIFECKSETKSLFHLPLWNNWKLLAAVAVSAGILFAAVESSALQMIFTTVPLSLPLWIVVAVFSCAIPICSAILFQITAKKKGGQ